MAHFAVRAIAIADEDISPRLGLQHVREVFSAHGGFLRHDVLGAHNAGHDLTGKVGLGLAVDGGGVVAVKFKLALGLKSGANRLGHLPHARLDQVEHLDAEGANRALQLAEVGHHIGGLAGVDHGDRNHTRVHGFFVARDDGLERLHHLAGDRHGVDPVVRQCRMAALASDRDLELVARGHDGPRADGKRAHRRTGPVVHAKYGLHGELVKQPIFDHFAGAATAFFGRLKDQVNGAVKVSIFRQMFGGRQQHGGVTIVATGVHLALVFAGMRKGIELLHGQRIDVSPQAHAASARATIAAVHDAHDTGGAHAAVNGNTPIRQLLGHHIGGSHFLKAKLRVGVDIFTNGRNAGCVGEERVDELHKVQSSGS